MILVAGSANLDFVVRAAHIPAPGETVLGRDFQTFPGGKGANQAVACARAGGAAVTMLVALGADDFAKPLLASLAEASVQLKVKESQAPTGTAFICVRDDGENAITVAPGANQDLRPEHWPSDLPITHLLMQLETPIDTVLAYAQAARAQGAKVVLNAAPARALPEALLRLVDVLIVNEGELASLVGEGAEQGDASAQLALLAKRYGIAQLIVTLGAEGAMAWHAGALLRQSPFAIEVVDTTGAGDTFCGALVAAMARGQDLQMCLREASAAGALACTHMGAQSSIPSREAVLALLAQSA
jgi:ribokinase